MPKFVDFAMQAAQSTVGGALGIMFGGLQNNQQLEQQKRLNVLNRDMLDYQYSKQYDLWKKTSYPGQVEMMEKAGLNPALMYGMSGGGGATTGSGSGGGSQAGSNQNAIAMAQAAAQMGLMRAQKENIETDTRLKEVGIPKAGAETSSILQGIENQKTQQKLMETENRLKLIKEKWSDLQEGNINAIMEQDLNIRKEQLQILENDANISEETWKTKVLQIRRDFIKTGVEIALLQAQTNLTNEQEKKTFAEKLQIEKITSWIDASKDMEFALSRSEIAAKEALAKYLEGQTGTLPVELREMLSALPNLLKQIPTTPQRNPIGFK